MAILEDINCGLHRCTRMRKTKSATIRASRVTNPLRTGGLFRGELFENLLGESLHERLDLRIRRCAASASAFGPRRDLADDPGAEFAVVAQLALLQPFARVLHAEAFAQGDEILQLLCGFGVFWNRSSVRLSFYFRRHPDWFNAKRDPYFT